MSSELEVNIDFDEASREWKRNKIHIGNCSYVYKCSYLHKNGKECNKKVETSEKGSYVTRRASVNTFKEQKSDIYCRQHAYVLRNNKNK